MHHGAMLDNMANPITHPIKLKIMYYIYILKLNNNQLYTGFTANLKRRISEHKRGKARFTSKRLPVELIHYEAYALKVFIIINLKL